MLSAYDRQKMKQHKKFLDGYERIWPLYTYQGGGIAELQNAPLDYPVDLGNSICTRRIHGLSFVPKWLHVSANSY